MFTSDLEVEQSLLDDTDMPRWVPVILVGRRTGPAEERATGELLIMDVLINTTSLGTTVFVRVVIVDLWWC